MTSRRTSTRALAIQLLPDTSTRWLCALLLLLLMPLTSHAQNAWMEGGRVYLPVVEAYPHNVSLELRILRDTFPVEFILEETGPAEGPVRASSAYWDGNLLVLPEVWTKGVSYWAELREIAHDRFRLESYGPNPAAGAPGSGNYQHLDWQRMPGEARDIGVGADGSVWAVGADDFGAEWGLYRWDGSNWWESRGSAVRVDVDPWGNPWIINSDNEIYRLTRGRWERLPGAANDIGIGADGSVWVVGVNSRRGGYSIFTLTPKGWLRVEGAGVRIDVDATGTPWVINDDDQIFRLEHGLWRRIPGRARDIGVGADGSVWVIGVDERAGGHSVYRYNGETWDRVPGSGSQISVGPDGEPWVVNREGTVYRSWGTYY
jgi:hypothetical protein